MANKMADKKKSVSQSEAAESKGRSGEKEQNKSAKAVSREREERREREVKESKSTKRESKQSPTFWARFKNYRPVRFVREAYNELRYKVTWPTFQEARNMTFVVIALSGAIAILLAIADFGLLQLFRLITQR